MKKLPREFSIRLKQVLRSEAYDKALLSFESPRPVIFRLHHRSASRDQVQAELIQEGFQLSAVDWYPDAFILKSRDLRSLQQTRVYRQEQIYVQGLSSILAALSLDTRPGEKILDLTAAPGSKAGLIARNLNGRGELWANEKIRPRYYKLKRILETQGYENVRVCLKPGERFGKEMPETFDRVLLDAPCSSEGRFSLLRPKTFAYWSPRKVREMQRKQKRLIRSAFAALKPGGTLVYATCTFEPEENEEVLSWAMEKLGESFEITDLSLPVRDVMPALANWDGRTYPEAIRKARRILPDEMYDGFFIAKIKKRES